MIGKIDDIEPPNVGRIIKKGQPLFSVKVGLRTIPFLTPISGKILKVNTHLKENLDNLEITIYNKNWICLIDTDNFDNEVKDLKIGKSAVEFYQDEIKDCRSHFKSIVEERKKEKALAGENGFYFGKIETLNDKEWAKTIKQFFSK